MGTGIHKHFVLFDEKGKATIEMFINGDGNLFIQEANNLDGFFFVVEKKDWDKMKEFIDEEFENIK